MQSKVIYIAGLNNEIQKSQIEQKLLQLHGVHKVLIEKDEGEIFVDFETPASLNNLEKEVYDLGYQILY
ncbi:putative copper chaperone CsoZ [Staphylococcus edaphicus]|uniref:Heavy-metal-associated domain-containing protein n=1 Tax=Staphylococcus edaphicus TaxID=1955013 RepID=A0A2C6WCJ9_9STAP|nr:heavy metal-associated domain-containing protein [Staphylococcus edaphicus]PHK48598.1 hypothetical protein BTJ66_12760 [Staphylococcus edaphicus]UQW82321.1 heavy-metal-associated domain-containing protein [Staphylococcus edaphicus]